MFALPPWNVVPWHDWQVLNPDMVAGFGAALAATPCDAGFSQPAACTDVWQSVPLKQPGAVPAAAGGDGGAMGELAPFV